MMTHFRALTDLAIAGMAVAIIFRPQPANAVPIGIGAFSASTIVINFDNLSGGADLSTGDIVTNQYAGLGVTFNDPDYPARANTSLQPGFSGSSAPNILFVQQHDGNPLGNPLQILFTTPQLRVGMLWETSLGPQITMQAFGSSGLLETLTLTSGSSCQSATGVCGFIGIERSEGITRVELSDPRSDIGVNFNFELDDVRFEPAAASCGNGIVEFGEQCDDGAANGTAGSCCSGTCQFVSEGTICRPAADVCDVAETCTGTSAACPPDAFAPATTICRPSAGACDVADTCTGTSPTCPADQLAPAGLICPSTSTTLPPSLCGNGAVDPGEQCDLGAAVNGTPGVCCTATCAFRAAGQECRPAADPCDIAETCGGNGAACPADARRNVGDVCDDGDPTTGISSCNSSGACTGVATMVTLQPETPVPPNQSPKRVRIPLTLAVPDTKGKRATALAQGLVNCIDLPPSFRPAQCGTASAVADGLMTRVTSVFLRVTPPVKRSLGRSAARSVTMNLPLTKLGQRLFARLASQGEGLTVQVQCRLRDRQGRQIDVAAPTTLRRQH
jgi:cysteine-rich repeat protein